MKVSEDFYSVQGEGISQGVPAYFIRLQGCNLMCGGKNGELVKLGKADWYCDSEKIWKSGKDISSNELIERIEKNNQLENVLNGETHLVWTGGEPTMLRNRKDIIGFLEYCKLRFNDNKIYNELETNGSVVVDDNFYNYIQQINCSPKLNNSGMSYDMRVNPSAIKQILNKKNSWFKFVINKPEDLLNMTKEYIEPFNIPKSKVLLMPGSDNINTLPFLTRMCYDLTKEFGYRTISRGHILAWNRTCGV